MKVLQIMPEFGLAGAEIMCENLCYQLKKNGVDVLVISLYDFHSAITKRLEDNSIKVIYLGKESGLDLTIIPKLIKVFRKERPDVIHTHRYVMQYAIPAAVVAGVKIRIHTVHNVAKKENTRIARKINALFYKFNSVIPVALSKLIQETISDEYKIDKARIPIIFNGIDLSHCIEKQDYNTSDRFMFLHIGRFADAKNHIGLVLAFRKVCDRYPECQLNLVGDGPLKDDIENKVKEYELENNIIFMGLKDNVYRLLTNSDAFILPSNYEGMPMTLIEAMGTGLPIIATKVGGIPDMLSDGIDSILVENNVDAIANAMITVIKNENLRKTIGENAIIKSKTFSSSMMCEKYMLLYKGERT